MTDTDTTTSTTTRSTAVRIAVVAAVAAVGFGGALLAFGGGDDAPPAADEHAADEHAADEHAADEHAEEPAQSGDEVPYEVAVDMDPDPPRVEGTAFAFHVTLDGEAVTGADVEFWADMDGHAHDGVNATATEVDPGRYEVDEQRFAMRGDWSGQVRVSADEGSASTPVRFTVE